MSAKQYCRGEARYVSTSEVAYSAEAGEAVHTPADGSAPHNLMGMHLPSEMLQQGMDDAEAAWSEYRDARVARLAPADHSPDAWRYDRAGAVRRSMRKREFIAGYLAALPEDQG